MKAKIISEMNGGELSAFLAQRTQRERMHLLDIWAELIGGKNTLDERESYIGMQKKIPDSVANEYKNHIKSYRDSLAYRRERPVRNTLKKIHDKAKAISDKSIAIKKNRNWKRTKPPKKKREKD